MTNILIIFESGCLKAYIATTKGFGRED